MSYSYKKPKKPNTSYKSGKLTRGAGFSRVRVNFTAIAILACVLLTFFLAMALGNYLGELAEDAKNTTTPPGGASTLDPPSADGVDPRSELHAFIADMTGADPEKSLSEQTSAAREAGNALAIELRDVSGKLIYTSDESTALSYPARENLTLSRLANHFAYYQDFAVAMFTSYFSHTLSASKRIEISAAEARILAEATDGAFGQVIIRFSGAITRENAVYYQNYLLGVKLACEGIPVGVELDYSFLSDADNSGIISEILSIADFFALPLGAASADALSDLLSPMVYLNERYAGVIILDGGEPETLPERVAALADKKMDAYIVK